MEAIREIKHIETNEVTINVPDEFLSRDVEIILLPINEVDKEKIEDDRKDSFFKFVDNVRFKLPDDYKFVREELYDRQDIS